MDVGCGEGWALNYFKNKGWNVLGLDYSEYGCKSQNPKCMEDVVAGEIIDNIQLLIDKQRSFNVIWLDNVLEHVLDPLLLLKKCALLLNENGVLVIEVPNDYSFVQQQLIEGKYISQAFWVAIPDHISYFNSSGLKAICDEAQLECCSIIGDFPIDLFLFNENTNYINNRSVGKSCHKARVIIENLLHNISVEKTNELYRLLAELGLGRQIVGFFKKRGEDK